MATYTFGDLVLDTTEKRVLRNNRLVEISGMPLAILFYLIEHAADGRTVTRSELRKKLWGCKIEDVTIRSNLSVLREALGDPVTNPRYVQTHGKEGWRLLLPVANLTVRPRSILPPAPGGSYDAAHYVSRPAQEQVLLSCLQTPGRPGVLFGPPGSGKRLLIERTLEQACQNASTALGRALRINIRAAMESPVPSLDGLLKEIGRLLLQASGRQEEDSRKILEAFWSPPILPKQKLRELVLHLLSLRSLGAKAVPTAIVLYDADWLVGSPFQDDVFNMLRTWLDDHFFESMRLLIATNLPPRLFPLHGPPSLWSKAHRMDVSRINSAQITQLAELHGVEPSQTQCERLGELVGWNVYLCHVALFQSAAHDMSLAATLASYQPEQRSFGPFEDHLEDLSRELERLDAAGTFSLPLGRLFQEGRDHVSLPTEIAWCLLRKGIVAETDTRNLYRCRCPLYADYFQNSRA